MTKNKKIILVLAILACGLFNLVDVFNPKASVPVVSTAVPLNRAGVAIGRCRQHVRDELLSSPSANFKSEQAFAIKDKPSNYHAVMGTVQAENAFGVVLESQFRCDLHYLPEQPEVWILDGFRLE